jgi:hypothetical protein
MLSQVSPDQLRADDDASGVSAVLELARVMATHQFDATIVFLAVAGEEQGLYGSNNFAHMAKAAGVNVAGMLGNDIVGSPNGVDARSVGGENDAPARQLARYAKEVASNDATGMQVQLVFRRDRFLRGGDQIPFLQNGYRSAVRFTETRQNFKHQHQNVRVEGGVQFGDLAQFVDFDYLAGVTRVNLATLATLADAPAAPAQVQIDATQLTNSTTLTWQPNHEPDLAGYQVVWRRTSDPDWQAVRSVGTATSVTLHRSKDGFFFGVQAVDRDGHVSPVSFPAPRF